MKERRFVFFDVGNTLLFPNRAKMLAPIATHRHPTLEQWQALESRTKLEFDEHVLAGSVNHGFWWTFHTSLLEGLGEPDGVREGLVRNSQNSALWDQILPGSRDALGRIARNHRLAVISNADGGVARVLARCGIADCFENITDSGIVGVEKPRREIFEAALRAMKASADESLYVGDVYSVDYMGARNAGMDAVLLDVAGTYRDRDLPRVESLEQLEGWLGQ
jgi:FMN phosphatase YigB (HAD superfamily)